MKSMILGLLFVFAACSSRAAYAAAPKDACALLTPAQVSAVLGVPAAGKALGSKSCIWVQTGVKPGSPRGRVDVVILIMQGYTQGYAVAKMPNAPTSAMHVSGLGDDAYYLSMTSGEAMELRVKKGSVAFGILVQRSAAAPSLRLTRSRIRKRHWRWKFSRSCEGLAVAVDD